MHTKAIDLKEFYATLQGRVVKRIVRGRLRHFWPDVKGQRVLGLGYALPYLRPFLNEAERVVALMSAHQGGVYWPTKGKCLVTMCRENAFPIETNSIDRIIAVHAFQDFAHMDAALRECWRVLTGQGRLILIVPNRAGIWARVDTTPFGHGTPYSSTQIRQILKDYQFVPERTGRALFMPPTVSRLMLATAPAWERPGRKFCNTFGGVNIVEVSKQLYASIPPGASPMTVEETIKQRILGGSRPVVAPERTGNFRK